ncbi:hypothetical protein GQ602_002550 [Ophiocordyceps camponoti-floridani]|uniref:Alpha/beta hydrolase fold-3 domain-containing protein n=1 Tax=Ophiocordyceps camponoti-floridani TaxID=2030778 RepID=A0A8H4QAX5_9HYPO|nr:hypothetical protein GQ602_002550 [Ophiocordyceps camponoti-floridani]
MASQEDHQLRVERRKDKSLLMRLLLALLKAIRPRLVQPKKPGKADEHGSPRLIAPKRVSRSHGVTERNVQDIWLYDVASKNGSDETQTRRRVFYFAGGGWQMPATPNHWAFTASLVDRLPQTTVTLVSYPLAPENPASVSMPHLKALYDTLMKEAAAANERVIVAGDSAGGNIALSLVLWALTSDPQASKPAAIMAISPSTDLRHQDGDMEAVADNDPTLTVAFVQSTARAWTADSDGQSWTADDARVSPTLARIELAARHHVQIHGVVGTWDVLSPEAIKFMDKCRDAGVKGQWLVWEGQMHCFPLAVRYRLRESVEAFEWIARVIGES